MRHLTGFAALALLLTPASFAKDEHSYDKGKLLSLDSVSCGYAQKSDKSVASEIIGTDSANTKTQEVLCQEYTIQTDRLIYHVRPKDTKHPVLLPVGETVDVRIQKDKMYIRAPEGDDKEREYQVVSIQMRSDAPASKNNP